MALETRLPKICWQSEASVTTWVSGSSGDGLPAQSRSLGHASELAIDLADDGSQREGAVRGDARAVDEPGIVEVAAGESEQVIAERDHRQADARAGRLVTVLESCSRRSKPALQGDQGSAELMAQAGQQASEARPDRWGSSSHAGEAARCFLPSNCTSMAAFSVEREGRVGSGRDRR